MNQQRLRLGQLTRALALLSLMAGVLALATPALDLALGFDLALSLPVKLAMVVGVQLVGVAAGGWLLRPKRRAALPAAIRWAAAAGVVASVLLAGYGSLRLYGVFDPYARQRAAWRPVVESEETILSLDPQLQRLSFAVSNLELPDFQSQRVFDEQLEWNDLTGERRSGNEALTGGIEVAHWEVTGKPVRAPRREVRLWSHLFESVAYFDHAKFYVVRGAFTTPAGDVFETDLGFEAKARMQAGGWSALKGELKAAWRRVRAETGEDEWRIFQWSMEELEAIESDRVLFEDVLDEALPNPGDLARARTSIHEQLVIDSLDSDQGPHRYFTRNATDRHPGVSVVDLNDDGFDDFYIMARWGPNLFYQNNGDGTFSEIADELGLAIENHTSSAIFADFDNDGDKDVFLGRTLLASMYLENVDNHFTHPADPSTVGTLPSLVSSVSVVDYDNDGLLDVYFSTYAVDMLNLATESVAGHLEPKAYSQLQKLLESSEAHEFLGMPGPPNQLLRNLGDGKFDDPGAAGSDLRVFSNSYQSTWADYDGDGDQDLYVANDFASNNLFRNEGGRFVDVAEETATTDIGFGMGASWGDYDNDGDQDLYVSNMYSKAGRRITAQFDYIDRRFALMARGNSMFRNTGKRFERVSGLDAPAMLVEKAGWSWGGQYLDVDNDGYLDIHALSGFYTAPQNIRSPDL